MGIVTSSLVFGIAIVTVMIIAKYRMKGNYGNICQSISYFTKITADKGESVPMERNMSYELHHPQHQRTFTEQTHVPPVYEVI